MAMPPGKGRPSSTPGAVPPPCPVRPATDRLATLAAVPARRCSPSPRARLPGPVRTGAAPESGFRPPELPLELWHQILGLLPVSAQGTCAQVCRGWRASLAGVRTELAPWLQRCSGVLRQRTCPLADSYSSRSRALLQTCHCALLPVLDRQYQELLQRQETLRHNSLLLRQGGPLPSEAWCSAERQLQRARLCLGSLVGYALYRQLRQADSLQQVAAPVAWHQGDVLSSFSFSQCSRWLVTACQAMGAGPDVLRLHGWNEGRWQRQTLVPAPCGTVVDADFCPADSDILLSHHAHAVWVWRRRSSTDTFTDNWYPAPLCTTDAGCELRFFATMAAGDLVLLSWERRRSFCRLLFLRYRSHQRGWAAPKGHGYGQWPASLATHPPSNQLALALVGRERGPYRVTEIHIWYRQEYPDGSVHWHGRASTLSLQQSSVTRLHYSPDGQHLLGLLSRSQIVLWAQDDHHSLQMQRILPFDSTAASHKLRSLAAFRSDGKQLAVPASRHSIRLWHRTQRGRWHSDSRLEAAPAPGRPPDGPDDSLRSVLLPADGNTLVRTTRYRAEIWHRTANASWQCRVRRINARPEADPPQACLLGPAELIITQAADPDPCLWIHGLNPAGQLVCKGRLAVDGVLAGRSPDGLSLLLERHNRPPAVLQLALDRSVPPDPEGEPERRRRSTAGHQPDLAPGGR